MVIWVPDVCLDKSHLNNLYIKKKKKPTQDQWSPLTNNTVRWSTKNSLDSRIYFLFINNKKKILNNVKYFLKIAKSCLPLQKKFSTLQICGMWGLRGKSNVHARAKMASQYGGGVCSFHSFQTAWVHNHELCLSPVETWTSFFSFSVPQLPHL